MPKLIYTPKEHSLILPEKEAASGACRPAHIDSLQVCGMPHTHILILIFWKRIISEVGILYHFCINMRKRR